MFAPIVLLVAQVLGRKELNQMRGKAIAAHSKVITKVCNRFGIDTKSRQSMIRTARDNGKKLGLLA
ncbi:electron transporter [filamentous cyanobacterium LEGE 11480]|uniref:Electron transporter n=1 Tax=Romeriopsis navalis LEGE 11480 TaxID=2777977 RepID=A0A928VRE1_9CYAN|nr:electron transporter [Romeriopsis navalis]MBE9033120.1 electron transporter [Romeriopsis navalis LEGE 11480]